MAREYDIVIVGGGMVGATLACALSDLSCRIALIERVSYQSEQQPAYDDRSIALAYGSRKIFEGLGLWGDLQEAVEPIHRIHVSDRGHFGAARMDCREQGVDALGYVIETREMGRILQNRLAAQDRVDVVCPASVERLHQGDEYAELEVDVDGEQQEFRTRLVIAADGMQSAVRQFLDIPTVQWSYGQTAIITNITPQKDHQQVAYERFTDTGPVAVLPMKPLLENGKKIQRCSVVCVVRDDQVEEVMALEDESFLQLLQGRFGFRLGRLRRIGSRHAYPLNLVRAREHISSRVALIGNAAHTLHPIAGQGYNLGLRDVAVLAELLVKAWKNNEDPGQLSLLRQYAEWRKRDHRNIIAFTDGMARIFTNPLRPVILARDAGLLAMDIIPPLKSLFTRHAMGLSGRLPLLARGLPLYK